MKSVAHAVLLMLSLEAFAQDQWKNVYTTKAWTERDVWQKADVIIRQMNVRDGSKVADIGCHEGYMTIKMAGKAGKKGVVYAVDIDQGKLDKLKVNLEERKITNVVTVKGNTDDPHLPPGTLDGVLILDAYHEMKSHDQILLSIKAGLRAKGRLVICEPIAEERRKLSREEQEKKHELSMDFALEDLQKAGFQILYRQDPFVDRERVKGDKMWIIVAIKR